MAGFANINGGLLVSLFGITDLVCDAGTQTQRSSFGNRWRGVYKYVAQLGRPVVGGREGTVARAGSRACR
jgi:hypothetical protein